MDADSLHASCRHALNLPSGLMIQYAASRSDSSIRTGSRTNFVWRSAHWIAYRRFHLRCRSLAELHCCNRSGLQKRLQGSITLPCASDNSIRDAATKPTRGTTAPIPPAEHGTGAYRRCSACGRGRPCLPHPRWHARRVCADNRSRANQGARARQRCDRRSCRRIRVNLIAICSRAASVLSQGRP